VVGWLQTSRLGLQSPALPHKPEEPAFAQQFFGTLTEMQFRVVSLVLVVPFVQGDEE
jgi:hypothetical protein